ncbi:MAG TPA: MMPL family transporter [Candidatus Caccalectryoclostridium excrementigallinarum]|uniref:MMPL family transporter n=1 Tax=Candidatus Caccalectryoclostridium excrementigallinarum TaxID=2840710 RepID=A0A9D1SKA1_9FIRM|nr:MMPL family transporter [Candidatus Caccalectryoclostridium excrementigallinarum]
MKSKSETSGTLYRFSSFVVRARWAFIALFLVAMILCAVFIPMIEVKYDLSSYMPEDSKTNIALSLLKEQFDDKGMAYVMVKGVSEEQATELAGTIGSIDGVNMATFIPGSPTSYNEESQSALFTVILDDYDSTEGAFAAVENIIDTLDKGGYENYLTGQSAYSYFTRLETEDSMLKIGIVIVVAILLILLFTSRTYFELVPMLAVFGVSVLLNMGTNAIFPGISYISNLITIVLQLALSLDYSIILLHRFMEERQVYADVKQALSVALSKGIVEILSSSLTTIAGLLALALMSLPIGVEIGLALAKGIVASLISVIFLMPALLSFSDKPLKKSEHKNFVPSVAKSSRAIVKARKVIVPLFLVIVVLAGVGQGFNTYSFNYNSGSMIVSGQDAIKEAGFGTLNTLVVVVPREGGVEKEKQLIEAIVEDGGEFDKDGIVNDTNINAIAYTEMMGIGFGDHLTKAQIQESIAPLLGQADLSGMGIEAEDIDAMIGVLFDDFCEQNGITPAEDTSVMVADLLDYMTDDIGDNVLSLMGSKLFAALKQVGLDIDPSAPGLLDTAETFYDMLAQVRFGIDNLRSADYSRITFTLDAGVEDEASFALIDRLYAGLGEYYEEFYITGESVACYDMADYFEVDNMVVCLCTLGFILVILLFTFRNFSLPIILALAIQGGIWINFAIPFLAGNSVTFIGYLIITAIQMGATIDYAIVLTNRYRTTKHLYPDRYTAMAESENAVFSTIITSGSILTITGFALGIAASGVVAQLGILLGIGTLASILIVLLILPSLLLVTEKLVEKTDFPRLGRKKSAAAEEGQNEREKESEACSGDEKAESAGEN